MKTVEQINYSLCRKNKVTLCLTDRHSTLENSIIQKQAKTKVLWRSPKVL